MRKADKHYYETDVLYIFLDESGDLTFTDKGSKYFIYGCITMRRPFKIHTSLDTVKYDVIEMGINQEYFHANSDNIHLKRRIFKLLNELPKKEIRIDSVIVEKRKTHDALHDPKIFLPRMIGYLLSHVFEFAIREFPKEIVVITDSIPTYKMKRVVEKAIKTHLKEKLPKGAVYRIVHHSSKAHYGLQVVDYCNWALFRKWEHGDSRAYESIKKFIQSEFEIFRNGITYFY